jgi:hypothetical protein
MKLENEREIGFIYWLMESKNFGILLVFLSIIVLVWILYKYFEKFTQTSSEIDARLSKLDSIVLEQKRITEATEAIKIDLAHADWSRKETLTIRRLKLEDLVLAIIGVRAEAIEIYRNLTALENNVNVLAYSEMDKVRMLTGLYFPELDKLMNELYDKQSALGIFFLDAQKSLKTLSSDLMQRRPSIDVVTAEIEAAKSKIQEDGSLIFVELIAKTRDLQLKCHSIMSNLIL